MYTGTIAAMVRNDYRTVSVFNKWHISYCCGGELTLEEACQLKGVDKAALEAELKQVTQDIRIPASVDFKNWSVDFLIDYIVNIHHTYLQVTIPQLQASLQSFVPSHIKKYPELEKVQEGFEDLAVELTEHMQKEERIVFPYIKQISSTLKNKEVYGPLFVRLLKKSLDEVTITDHQRIEALLKALRATTQSYTFPDQACTRYRVIYQQLKEFDADLVQHKHLENNILFPKGVQLERELLDL